MMINDDDDSWTCLQPNTLNLCVSRYQYCSLVGLWDWAETCDKHWEGQIRRQAPKKFFLPSPIVRFSGDAFLIWIFTVTDSI
jgi:hypothetical protein